MRSCPSVGSDHTSSTPWGDRIGEQLFPSSPLLCTLRSPESTTERKPASVCTSCVHCCYYLPLTSGPDLHERPHPALVGCCYLLNATSLRRRYGRSYHAVWRSPRELFQFLCLPRHEQQGRAHLDSSQDLVLEGASPGQADSNLYPRWGALLAKASAHLCQWASESR